MHSLVTHRAEPASAKMPAVGLIIPVGLGLLVRLSFVLASDFPLHDGGLFYQMVQELQAAGLALPLYTSYNGGSIPFAYPPLAFYLVAIVNWITGIDLLQLFRFWPLAISTLTIVAFYPLAARLLEDRFAAWAATLAFALLPGTYTWRMMGGGLTRSLGFLFFICALSGAYAMFRAPSRRSALAYGLCAGLAVLSHPEAAYFTAYTSLIFLAVFGRNRRSLAHFLLAGAAALAVAGPWLVTIVGRYGPGIFMLANQRSPAFTSLVAAIHAPTAEPFVPIWLFLAGLGALVCLGMRRRQYLPAWFVVVALLQARGAEQVLAVPVALLAGIGFRWAWAMIEAGPAALVTLASGQDAAGCSQPAPRDRRSLRPAVLLGLVVGYGLFGALAGSRDVLQGLSPEIRSAMGWAAAETPSSGKFLVLAPGNWLDNDRVSEWFPVLAERTSVVTDQGYEWTGQYPDRNSAKMMAEGCVAHGAECLEQWSKETAYDYDFVFLAKLTGDGSGFAGSGVGEAALRTSLRSDPRYAVLYDGPGATIARRQAAGTSALSLP